MKCPVCNHPGAKVIDSRMKDNLKLRRRECTECGHRFNSVEIYQTSHGRLIDIAKSSAAMFIDNL